MNEKKKISVTVTVMDEFGNVYGALFFLSLIEMHVPITLVKVVQIKVY